ncbi:hypothetical protein ACWEN6_01210 [Sphaerisporangium sp. NPDC004334]
MGKPGAGSCGRTIRATARDDGYERAVACAARLHRPHPYQRWVADITHVMTWVGLVYVAFTVDAYSRAIVD